MSKMVILGRQLQQSFPVLAGVSYSCLTSATVHACAVNSVSTLSSKLKKWNNGGRLPRRLVLGLGTSFWAQYMNMAGNCKSFIASARQKGAVEQVHFSMFIILLLICFLGFLFSCTLNYVGGL